MTTSAAWRLPLSVLLVLSLVGSMLVVTAGPSRASEPAPEASLNVPASVLIGDSFSFTATFDNVAATSTGYGPYLDVFLPVQGADGDPGADPIEPPDGISFTGSATYLGADVTVIELELACDGTDVHPFTGLEVSCPAGAGPGDVLLVLELPFGSFTPTQPPASVDLEVELSDRADLGVPLPITAQAGFRYGADPLDNPDADPPIVQDEPVVAEVTPTLASLSKSYLGPEDETATGPNFPRTWLVELTVAEGQTLTDVALTDLLPDNVAFLDAEVTVGTGSITTEPPDDTPQTAGVVEATFPEVTGTGGVSAAFEIAFYVPEFDAADEPVIDPANGQPVTSENEVSVTGSWQPIDERDDGLTDVELAAPATHMLTDRSLAIQKSVAIVNDVGASGPSPGDTIEWTLNFQVSDFFVFDDLAIADVLSDGQSLDASFTPVLSFDDVEGSVTGHDITDHLTVEVDDAPACEDDGNISYAIALSGAIADALPATGGRLTGGLVDEPNDGPTTGTIRFRTVINDRYRCLDDGAAVDSRDSISNSVQISGAVLDRDTGTPTGSTVTDTSSASVTIVSPSLNKDVYARNGDTSDTGPRFAAGDTITYRLTATLPITNVENVSLIDFLPLPVLEATEVTDTSRLSDPPSATPPPAGAVSFGPFETLADVAGGPGSAPTLTVDATGNSLTFDYDDIQDQDGLSAATIDLLFTVTLTDKPFADGLFLTNQARLVYSDSFEDTAIEDEIVQFELTNPVLDLTKGAVAVDGNGTLTGSAGPGGTWSVAGVPRFSGTVTSEDLASSSVGTDVTGAWAGDTVAYALVVENTGSGLNGAFDVTVSDEVPDGMAVPTGGAAVQVHDGSGAALPFTGDLFAGGITLTDPDPQTGALAPFDATSGENIAVITYLLEVDDAGMGDALVNTATLESYASAPGGPSYPPVSDSTTVTVDTPVVVKTLTSTSAAHTDATDAAIGEQATYEVTVSIPPSTTDAVVLRDTLPTGMAFVSFDTLTADASLSSSVGTFADILTGLDASDVSLDGRRVDIDLGTVTNTSTSPADITFTFTASMLNVDANQDTVSVNNRRNTAQLRVDGSVLDQDRSVGLRIVEPALTVSKDASTTVADAGDTVTYTVVVSHPDGTRRADAFDVELADVVPDGMTYVPGSLTHDSGLAPNTLDDSGAPDLSATWDVFEVGGTATLTYQATVDVDAALVAGADITNTVDVTWTSLPGDDPSTSPYTDGDVQRTGDDGPGGSLNDYATSDSATLDPVPSTITKDFVEGDFAHTDGSELTIGETATYELTVTLPEGDIGTVTVTDDVPGGMAYVGGTVTVDESTFGGNLGDPEVNLDPAGGSSGQDLTLIFDGATGDGSGPGVSSTPTGGTTGTTFTVTYDLVVVDVGANSAGDTRNNSATVTVAGSSSDPDSATVTLVEPDVTIDKSFDPDEAAANDTTTVTLTVTNGGDSGAFDVVVSDVLDGDVFTDVTLGTTEPGWAGATLSVGDDTEVQFTFAGPFAPGATATFTFDVTLVDDLHVNNTVPGSHTNTATVTSSSAPDGASDESRDYSDDDDADLALIVPDLRTVKTGPTAVASGQTLTYTITVHNDGDRAASNVTIVDELPDSPFLTYDSSSPTGVFDALAGDNGTVTWTLPSLAAGGQEVFEVSLTVDETVPFGADGTTFTNTADAQHDGSNGPDPTPENNDDDHTVTLDATIDVAVTKTASVAEVGTGDTFTYDLVVTNVGNEDAEGITVTDTLPDHVTFVSATGGGTHAGGEVSWTGLDLLAGSDPGTSITYTVTVTVDATVPAGVDELTNTVEIDAPGDTNPTNDQDTADVDLDAAPELTITKDDDASGGLVAPGDTLTYTLTVANVGDQGATGIEVTDTLPAGVTFVSASNGGTLAGSTVTWNLPGELAAGDDVELTVTVTVDDPLPPDTDELVNAATVTDDGNNSDEPTTDDDTATTRLNVTSIDKALTDTSAAHTSGADLAVGEVATYELTVRLPEGDDLGTVTVTDLVPAGMAYVPGSLTLDTTGFQGLLVVSDVNLDDGPATEGAPLIVTFDDVEVDATGDAAAATFTLTFDVQLLDVAGNVDGTVRTNTASVTVAGATTSSNPVEVTVVEPVLDITKTFGFPDAVAGDTAGTTAAGDTVTVTLTVDNTSDVDAFDVVVTDVLDGDAFTSVTVASAPGGWTTDVDTSGPDPVFTAQGGSLAASGSAVFMLELTVASDVDFGTTLVNTAQVVWESLPGDGDQVREYGPVSDDDEMTFTAPDLRVVKTRDGSGIVEPGGTVTFDIVVHNDGGRQASGVVLVDTLPDHTTFAAASGGGSHTNGVVTWPAFDLAAGGSATFTVEVTVDDPVPADTILLTNTATATDDGTRGDDPTPENNTDTANVPLEAFVDVAVSKSADVADTPTGGQIVYTITVTNLGNEGVNDVTVTDVLDEHTTFVSATAGGTHDAGTVTWTGIDFDGAGGDADSVTLQVTVDVDAAVPAGVTTLTNTTEVDAPGDINPDNDQDTATVTLDARPDLRLVKTADADAAATGDTVTYTLTVTNVGDQGATGLVVIDTLPAGVTFVDASDDGVHDDGETTWTLPDELPAGGTVEVTVTVQLDDPLPDGTTLLVNTATVTDDGTNGADPTPEDNTDTAEVITGADLAVTKTLDSDLIPGATGTYRIEVTNLGPEPVTALTLIDTPGPGLSNPSFAPQQGSYDPATGIWEDLELTVGATVVMLVTVEVSLSLTETTTNQVNVTPVGAADPDPSNNEAIASGSPSPLANAAIDKTLTQAGDAGGQAVYRIVVSNDGPSNATGVTVTDVLPAGLTVAELDADGWTCDTTTDDESTQTLSCILDGLLGPDASAAFDLTVDIAADVGGEIVNTATVAVAESETTLDDNTDAAALVLPELVEVPDEPPATDPPATDPPATSDNQRDRLPRTGIGLTWLLALALALAALGTPLARRRR